MVDVHIKYKKHIEQIYNNSLSMILAVIVAEIT